MGIRETLNKNYALSAVATAAVILIALIVIIVQLHKPRAGAYVPKKVFFTDNDGDTWFAADHSNIPPFTDEAGLTAVRCYLFKCGKTTFVGYLEKFTDEAKRKLTDAGQSPPAPGTPDLVLNGGGRMVKKRGDAVWVLIDPRDPDPQATQKATNILQVNCPDGASGIPTPVNP